MREESDNEVHLIGVQNIATPEWAQVDEQAASAGFLRAVRTLPEVFRVVARLAWRASPTLSVLAVVVHVVSGCATAFGLLATADVFSALLSAGPTPQRVLDSLGAIAVVVVTYAVRALLDSAVSAVQGALRPRVTRAAGDEVTAAVTRVLLINFEDADFRELARRGRRDGVHSIDSSIRNLAEVLSSGIAMVAALATAALLDPWLMLVLSLAALAEGIASGRAARLNRRHFVDTVTRNIRKAVIEEAATSREFALERHALSVRERLLAEYRRVSASLMQEDIRLAHRQTRLRLLGRGVAGVGTGAAYLVLGLLLYTGGMPLALAGTAVLAMRTASTALSNTTRAVNLLYEDAFLIEFYNRLLTECAQRTVAAPLPAPPVDPAEIRLSDVSFTYPGQPEPALRGIDLTLRRGEIVALVGENGSGKTTLGKVLCGLYRPDSGTVTWDGVDLSTVDTDGAHDQIAVIAQEPAQWPMTAEHNIVLGALDRPDPDGRAWAGALSAARADEVLDSLPHREKTLLSRMFQDGQDLSGGQWQRLGIARGVYRDAHILIADEPTASLDAKAEARAFAGLQSASARGAGSRTTILVTHRLANIKNADRIVVLDRGRIVAQGGHAELLAERGLYHELFTIQAAAYADTTETASDATVAT